MCLQKPYTRKHGVPIELSFSSFLSLLVIVNSNTPRTESIEMVVAENRAEEASRVISILEESDSEEEEAEGDNDSDTADDDRDAAVGDDEFEDI